MLIWQRPRGTTLATISYESTAKVPSWSWVAVYGEIEFPVPVTMEMEWLQSIAFDNHDTSISCEVTSFSGIVLAAMEDDYCLQDCKGQDVGRIRYDWSESQASFESHHCVVLGRSKRKRDDYYGIVVVATTGSKDYQRVGFCSVNAVHLVRSGSRGRLV